MTLSSDKRPKAEEIRKQLDRILASDGFVKAGQSSDLLTYLVENTINGDEVKAEVIRAEVFPSYRPESNIVRVVATQLRGRLAEYYESVKQEPIIISFPRVPSGRSYKVDFSYHRNPEAVERYRLAVYLIGKCNPELFPRADIELHKSIELEPSLLPAFITFGELRILELLAFHISLGTHIYSSYFSEAGLLEQARVFAQTATILDPYSSQAHLLSGIVSACYREWGTAAEEIALALQLDSPAIENHPFYIAYLVAIGRGGEAVDLALQRTIDDPIDPDRYSIFALIQYAAGPMASNIKPPRSLDEQNIFHTLPTELSILNRAHDARFGTYECLKLDDLYAWRAEQTFFYVYGLKCLGKARLKEPKIFFERELSRDVRFNFVVYHDEPYNERSPSWKTALLGLREIIDWKHGEPQGVEIALAYMALAEIKLHRGIPIGWYDLDELGIRHKGSMVLPGAVPNSCEVYSPDDRDMRMFIDYAIASLEHACEQNDPLALWLHRLPIFKPLRDEATFKDLIARLTLP